MASTLWFSPERYHQIANIYYTKRWQLLLWSFLSFTLFILLENQIFNATPNLLVAFALFFLFFALQTLVLASFLFFFKSLPSKHYHGDTSYLTFKFYRTIEWTETILFSLLTPLPTLGFIYAILMMFRSS